MVTTDDGGLDRRGGAPDVLAHRVQALKEDLAGHSDLFGEGAHTDLGHISPSWSVPCGADRITAGWCSLLSTHRVLISVEPASGSLLGHVISCAWPLETGRDRRRVERDGAAQRAPERPSAEGLLVAVDAGVQPGATPRRPTCRVGDDGGRTLRSRAGDHAQEYRPAIRPTASDARPDGPVRECRLPESSPVGVHKSSRMPRQPRPVPGRGPPAGLVPGRLPGPDKPGRRPG